MKSFSLLLMVSIILTSILLNSEGLASKFSGKKIAPSSKLGKRTFTKTDYSIDINTELLRFYKCYAVIARTTPDLTDSDTARFVQILQNKRLPDSRLKEMVISACMELLQKANLFETGNGYELEDSSDEMSKQILKNFSTFHRTWTSNLDHFDKGTRATTSFREHAEASLRITRALFDTSSKYSEILKGTDSFQGIRANGSEQTSSERFKYATRWDVEPTTNSSNYLVAYTLGRYYSYEGNTISSSGTDNDVNFIWREDPISFSHTGENGTELKDLSSSFEEYKDEGCFPSLLETGELIGIKKVLRDDCTIVNFYNLYFPTQSNKVEFYEHPGGGAAGHIMYLLHNVESSDDGVTDRLVHTSSDKFARRWAQYVLKDFTCRNIPVLSSYVSEGWPGDENSETAYQDHTFRGNPVCMECHSTIDPMSAALRNTAVQPLGHKTYTGDDASDVIVQYASIVQNYDYESCYNTSEDEDYDYSACLFESDIPSDEENHYTRYDSRILTWTDRIWPRSDDNTGNLRYFYRAKPYGRFTFDDINGNRINTELEGVEELGKAITNTIDFYSCAVKRYFHLFTGEEITLFSDYEDGDATSNPNRFNGEMTSNQLEKFEFIRTVGTKFMLGEKLSSLSSIRGKSKGGKLSMITESEVENLQDVIEVIISSDYFLESVLGVGFNEESSEDDSTETEEEEDDDEGTSEDTYTSDIDVRDIYSILDGNSCLGCHDHVNVTDEWLNEDYVETDFYQLNGDDVAPIIPGDSCASLFYTMLQSHGCTGVEDGTMPSGMDPLSDGDLEMIKEWIDTMVEAD